LAVRWAAATALLATLGVAPAANAQTFFYTEVTRDGRIYVFASSSRYDAFRKSNGADIGPVTERPGYGPNGETVVFDSADAINLYNFKHGLPYRGDQRLTLGIHPTLTFDWLEGFWGLRHIEKTPADLYRLDSSRDFGFTFDGPTAIHGLNYGVQFGNESGSGSETQEGKILRFETRYARKPGIALEGFYSFGRRPEGANRHTGQAVGGFLTDVARVGAQYLWQERKSGQDDVADQTIAIWSGFAVWEFLPKKANLFFRVDDVTGHLGDLETGLPGADGIDYWLLSTQSHSRPGFSVVSGICTPRSV
jgi:hypothetical protein